MLASLNFLLGQWQALSKPGEPSGRFSFVSQLQGKIILRSNQADYPASNERPAFRHEDLMVIYCDEGQNLLADYYDSEGHVIRYSGEIVGEDKVNFTSKPANASPSFRLRYSLEQNGILNGAFELALPDEPNVFRPYLNWSAIKGKDI